MSALFARIRLSGVVLAALVVTAPALADAPTEPPQYQAFDRDTVEITDNFTKLVWDRRRVLRSTTHDVATATCSTFGLPLDYRLPTVKELLTLVDEDRHSAYDTSFPGATTLKAIDRQAFPDDDTPTDKAYWTSTPGAAGTFFAVDFTTGETREVAEGTPLHARCMR